ncbi:glycoside hydrolase family 31 protein [Fimbriimonas ginsengisoli]|uniref:Alpha-glucosidase n=1 Tax=Fimbriimonas ginsengisoli Gsoil 348 TaxID=661478 RepID=A0A068NV36_FIMGI|nr:glycoside hydrolase family 31 protein [Fimbriimonas ginsengisoli]AIE85449.1 Alpha-glucosidase [Fimbriimonas ginsengisoli Gsoil 348]
MYFNKYPHRSNFSFVETFDPETGVVTAGVRVFATEVDSHEGDIYHVRVSNPDVWPETCGLSELDVPAPCARQRLKANDDFQLSLLGRDAKPLITGEFGVSGDASMFVFELGGDARFYGMGEKYFGKMELSGYRTKFWNTDVWGDFHFAQWGEHPSDPPYFSLPYLVAKIGDEYVGFLLHNSHPTFIETPGSDESRVFVEWQRTSERLILGSEGGEPNLWVIYGPSLAEVTRKLQKLIGTTPVPPAWSLGYHQSRWGYGGHADLMRLDEGFAKHKIPCDGLWLDLDYMDGFRIFQTNEANFPDGVSTTAETLAKHDRHIVPIIDPGVKKESGYRVYDDGHAQRVFCQNAEGGEYVGLVWPGETVFPDFTLPRVSDWWAGYIQEFAESGFGACWIDMNDPSTGPVDPNGMRFADGKLPHEAHHNDYSLGMQRATFDGFRRARPHERPFILSRSGFIGSSRYAAIWTGDNLANRFYLKSSIPTSVNLSISGQPFNGADLGGFGGDVTDELMLDWTKAHFLFPFLRNHANRGTRDKEPFAFPEPVMAVIRRYIRLRYKLFPYLYNLFVQQEEQGDPILRPLFYEFDGVGLDKIDDQFMVGPSILQAPFVEEGVKKRTVTLPGLEPWYDAANGDWIEPGERTAKAGRESTPLYLRAGAIVPMQPGTPVDNTKELRDVNLHLFMPPAWSGESELEYVADDGISYAYTSGARSRLKVRVVSVDGNLAIATDQTQDGFGLIAPTFVIHGDPKSVRLNGSEVVLEKNKVTLAGKPLAVVVVRA